MIVEIILLVVMLVLIIVLVLETRAYLQSSNLVQALDGAILAYSETFTSLVDTIKAIEVSHNQTTDVHQTLSDQLTILWNIIEVHNRALQLDPLLTKIGKNENKIP